MAVPGSRAPRPISAADVIFGGTAGDTTSQISAAQANGKFVVLLPAAAAGRQSPAGAAEPAADEAARSAEPSRFAGAAAVATIDLDALTPAQRAALERPDGRHAERCRRPRRSRGRAAAAAARRPHHRRTRSRSCISRSMRSRPAATHPPDARRRGAALRPAVHRRPHARHHRRLGHRVARFHRDADRMGAQRRRDHSRQRPGAQARVRRDRRAQRSHRHEHAGRQGFAQGIQRRAQQDADREQHDPADARRSSRRFT